MQEQLDSNTHDYEALGDEISLLDIVKPLWQSRWLIIFVTLSVVACGLAGSLYFKSYKSDGFLQFGGAIPAVSGKDKDKDKVHGPGISLSDYKSISAFFSSSDRFDDFVQEKQLRSNVGVDNLYKVFQSPSGITKLIQPVYPFTKLDARELMEQPNDNSNNAIGLSISYSNQSPETAQQMVGLLGRYVMDSIIYKIYSNDLQFKHSEMLVKMDKLNNDIIANKELLDKYRRTNADLKKIVARYPASSRQASTQVFSVTDDSARYLAPITLLAANEVQASAANESIRQDERDLRKSALLQEYYDAAKVLLDKTKSGETLLRGLQSVKTNVFKGKNLDDDLIKEVYNKISIDNQQAIDLYLDKCHFIAGPTLPIYSTPSKRAVLLVSLVLGLFLSVLLVFSRNWLRDNWLRVTD